ncbi:MAG: hypothetical protein U0Q16_29015 [Bryobacteraceae bacterium]
MPESERRGRTIFYDIPHGSGREQARAARPRNGTQESPMTTPNQRPLPIIFDALRPFADARAAMSEAFGLFKQQHGGPVY